MYYFQCVGISSSKLSFLERQHKIVIKHYIMLGADIFLPPQSSGSFILVYSGLVRPMQHLGFTHPRLSQETQIKRVSTKRVINSYVLTSNSHIDKKLDCIVLKKVYINLRRRDICNNKTSSHVTHMSFSIKNHNLKNTFVQIYKFINHFRLCTILTESHFPQFFLGHIALFHFLYLYTVAVHPTANQRRTLFQGSN